jgi:hypothetical protein
MSLVWISRAAEVVRPSSNVTITFQRFVTKYDTTCAEFIASNCTSRVMWFTGHNIRSPAYEVQCFISGEWEDWGMGWCGVGMDRHKLGAHKTVSFTVPLIYARRSNMMRVGLSCSPHEDYNREEEKTYWSEKLERKPE